MLNTNRVNLNLASHPSKNRRLFYLLVFVLGVIFIIVSLISANIYFSYNNKSNKVAASISEMDHSIRDLEEKEKRDTGRIEDTAKDYKERIDLINGIIYRKSFSWIDFLSCLEEALPDSSYIVSLAPTLTEDLKMNVRFKVVSPSLDDLLKLVNSLEDLKFRQVKVLNEAKNEQGFLLSEISLTYERNI